MTTSQRFSCNAALVGLCLAVTSGAYAQVGTINSAVITTRAFNDVPSATLTSFALYPAVIAFGEKNVSKTNGFANRDTWQFSNNGGVSAYQFQNGNNFNASMTLQLSGSPTSPRKEAGFLFSTVNAGDIQFVVNTDGHEVVQFGGISFYSFSVSNSLSYNSGDLITLGLNYFVAGDGKAALQFSANGHASPVFKFAPGVIGIGSGTLGGYFQIANDPLNPANSGSAVFQNISIVAVPEPSSFFLVGAGLLTL